MRELDDTIHTIKIEWTHTTHGDRCTNNHLENQYLIQRERKPRIQTGITIEKSRKLQRNPGLNVHKFKPKIREAEKKKIDAHNQR